MVSSSEELHRLKQQMYTYIMARNAAGTKLSFACTRRQRSPDFCSYKMISVQKADGSFEVYTSGEHNHSLGDRALHPPRSSPQPGPSCSSQNSHTQPYQLVPQTSHVLRQLPDYRLYAFVNSEKELI